MLDQSPSSPLDEIDEAFAEQIEQDICEELTERTETIEEESAMPEDGGSVYNENLISALEKKNKVAANVDPFQLQKDKDFSMLGGTNILGTERTESDFTSTDVKDQLKTSFAKDPTADIYASTNTLAKPLSSQFMTRAY